LGHADGLLHLEHFLALHFDVCGSIRYSFYFGGEGRAKGAPLGVSGPGELDHGQCFVSIQNSSGFAHAPRSIVQVAKAAKLRVHSFETHSSASRIRHLNDVLSGVQAIPMGWANWIVDSPLHRMRDISNEYTSLGHDLSTIKANIYPPSLALQIPTLGFANDFRSTPWIFWSKLTPSTLTPSSHVVFSVGTPEWLGTQKLTAEGFTSALKDGSSTFTVSMTWCLRGWCLRFCIPSLTLGAPPGGSKGLAGACLGATAP